ncbi:TetR/AcrR family transcriptional regulator [Actinomycetospora endophytica]|uniref:TetR/AcrR family transcriptional regulator n=1 Tax=Actinomycetospora endophytica TaxID=2291215 RepID=A0ABS8P8U1_9PSEU|nr:TetR/AcrR family transcriptional regulator [Actinomycetospora endophytica]MCD2194524.1 TetR/AcrR family transcriptional regulator [Actinomycetospora endophytica]
MARRTDALSKERIVEVATGILDAGGEDALTFRTLTTRLSTGYGAIYHHVANKGELLAAATDEVVSGVIAGLDGGADPREGLRALALGLFDAIDTHPWVGAQLAAQPSRPALLDVYERVGERLHALGVPEPSLFDAAGALVNYVLGVAGQNAANARVLAHDDADRSTYLATVAAQWEDLDPERYPFVRRAATRLADHDDRAQFLAGVDLILAGIGAVHGR